MFKKAISWLRHHGVLKEESELSQRKKIIKDKIKQVGVTLKDVENILFWETPVISFCFYLVYVVVFWKFISYELQRIGLTILLLSGLTIVGELRKIFKGYMQEKSFIDVKQKNRNLGFNLDDVVDVSAQTWLACESHVMYLMQLKDKKDPGICFYLALYIGILCIMFSYIPMAEVIFTLGTFLYFYPVCSYLGVIEKLFERFERIIQPIAMQWGNTQTKRTRNRKYNISTRRVEDYLSDSEDEDFIPSYPSDQPRELPQKSHSRLQTFDTEDSMDDEFDLRGKIHMNEGHSSDYDEDSFLPRTGAPPSMSQYDSLMEPLDDEFHAGLDFENVTARSVSDFGIPNHFLAGKDGKPQQSNRKALADDTDEDIDDLPVEEADGTTRYANLVSYPSASGRTSVEGNGFEFVDKTELHDVTDEEINEQNVGHRNKGLVSNMLGY